MITFRVVEDATVDGAGSLEGGTVDNPVKVLTKPTNQAGLASVYYTLGKHAGLNIVRASGTNLLPSYREFSAKGLPDYPNSMEEFAGNNQKMEMGKILNDPIKVLVKDRFGNPAPGGIVSFVVTEGQGKIVTPQPVLSDRNGVAAAKWQLGPYALNIVKNKVIATSSLPGGTYTVPFSATGELNHYPEFTSFNDP
ncbi:MAG: hypothetical protein GXO75_01740, partial [Calditrichaeota bacterium]|nr:hypothetical protein [Calditrichota bacterium]